MEIRYVMTLEEFKESYSLMLRNASWHHRFCYWYWSWLGLVIGLWILLMVALLLMTGGPDMALLAILVVVAVLGLLAPWRYRGIIRRNFRLQKLDGEILIVAGPDGVEATRLSRDMRSRYGWPAIERLRESKNMFVLFPSRLQFIPIPKRAMTAEQHNEFRALVAAHVPGLGQVNLRAAVS